MNLLRTFGIGNKKIIEDEHCIAARVIRIRRCWWAIIFKIPNLIKATKEQSLPHIITFKYKVDGIVYKGTRYIDASVICPHIDETILIYYDEGEPRKYAVEIYKDEEKKRF